MTRRQDASTGQIVDDGTALTTDTLDGKATIHTKVYSPYQTYFDEAAFSVSAENDTGPFDILPQHHNFITLLNACELVLQTQQGEQRIRISGGLMHVKANQVVVFLDV